MTDFTPTSREEFIKTGNGKFHLGLAKYRKPHLAILSFKSIAVTMPLAILALAVRLM